MITMLRLAVRVAAGTSLSDTCTVKVDMPAPEGTPEIPPLVAFSVTPFGRLPCATDQEYGAIPPVAANVAV